MINHPLLRNNYEENLLTIVGSSSSRRHESSRNPFCLRMFNQDNQLFGMLPYDVLACKQFQRARARVCVGLQRPLMCE